MEKLATSLPLNLLLSALLFNAAFFAPDSCGFLILFFWMPLVPLKLSFKQGFMWGVLVFGPHFIWLLHLLLTCSHTTVMVLISLYLSIVLYYALTSGFLFLITQRLRKWAGRVTSTWLIQPFIFLSIMWAYFYFLIHKSLWFMQCTQGYPFINPLLPLINYKWFLFLCGLLWGVGECDRAQKLQSMSYEKSSSVATIHTKGGVITFVHVPLPYKLYGPSREAQKRRTPQIIAHDLYQRITQLPLYEWSKKGENIVLLLPESSFPYPLNEHQNTLSLLMSALPANAHLLIGSQRKENRNLHQTVYWCTGGRITHFYDKRNLVDFVETPHPIGQSLPCFKGLFSLKQEFFSKGSQDTPPLFSVNDNLGCIPLICSEGLISNYYKLLSPSNEQKQVLGVMFINDSWFLGFFRRLLFRAAYHGYIVYKTPIILVSHQKMLVFE